MKRIYDTGPGCEGRIDAKWVNKTGDIIPLIRKTNVVTYTAADIIAGTVSGDNSYLPQYVGFIYGTDYSPLLDDPDTLPVSTRRAHDWDQITSDVAAITGNMLISPFATAPSLSLDGSADLYSANAVTFSAHTGLMQEYGFSTTSGTYAADLDTLESSYPDSVYFYQVVLLNRWQSGTNLTYVPFARAALDSAPFTPKPDGFELAVYWTITFK